MKRQRVRGIPPNLEHFYVDEGKARAYPDAERPTDESSDRDAPVPVIDGQAV